MRSLIVCLFTTLLFAACAEDPPEPEALTIEPEEEGATVPTPPQEIIEGADDLLGRWVILEQAGTAPEDLYYVTFTREGDYIVQNEAGSTERSSFRPAGENLITITDSTGTRRYAYEVDGNTLTLGIPGSETRTVLERRN